MCAQYPSRTPGTVRLWFVGSAPPVLGLSGTRVFGMVGNEPVTVSLGEPQEATVSTLARSLGWQPTTSSAKICAGQESGSYSPGVTVQLAQWGDLTAVFAPMPGGSSIFAELLYNYGGWAKSSLAGSVPTVPAGHPLADPLVRLDDTYGGTPVSIGVTVSDLQHYDPSALLAHPGASGVWPSYFVDTGGVVSIYSPGGPPNPKARISEMLVSEADC